MKVKFSWLGCMTVTALACVGCDGVEDDSAAAGEGFGEGAIQARFVEGNDWKLNDWKLNDWKLNGFRAGNSKLYADNGVDYIQTTQVLDPDGWPTSNVQLVGGMLKVAGEGGFGVEGSEFKYTVKTGNSTATKRIWVNYAYTTSQPDVWEYQVQFSANGTSWPNFCDGPFDRALILPGLWDGDTGNKVSNEPGALTFACLDGAIAKCVKFGYRPWANKNGVSLESYHQACTRMVRADYCGDGTPHTLSGTPIHVLDQLGIQNADPSVEFDVEAEWGPNGAVCLNPNNTRISGTAANLSCNIPTCGASFASGGLIQSGKIVP